MSFQWVRPTNGFRWVTVKQRSGVPVKIAVSELGGLQELPDLLRREPQLFRKFAIPDPSPDALIDLLDEHGPLYAIYNRYYSPLEDDNGSTWTGVRYDHAAQDLRHLATTVTLWDQVRARDLPALRKQISMGVTEMTFKHEHGGIRRQLSDFDPAVRASLESGDLLVAANALILWFASGSLYGPIVGYSGLQPVIKQQADGSPQIHFAAQDLLSALWLQFLHEMSGATAVKPCETCGKWMEITPPATRRSRRFCSPTCQKRAKRKNRGN